MSSRLPIALVTGANRGIGLEIAKQLLPSHHVVFASRSVATIPDVVLAQENAEAIVLDVTNDESISAAFREFSARYEKLDILVNNAGLGADPSSDATTRSHINKVIDVNVAGVAAVSEVFVPLLAKSTRKNGGLIVNISSERGLFTFASSPKAPPTMALAYSVSKAALNLLTIEQAKMYHERNVKVIAVGPGFTKTAFNGYRGTRLPEDSVKQVLKVLEDGRNDVHSGTYWRTEGEEPAAVEWSQKF